MFHSSVAGSAGDLVELRFPPLGNGHSFSVSNVAHYRLRFRCTVARFIDFTASWSHNDSFYLPNLNPKPVEDVEANAPVGINVIKAKFLALMAI